MKAESVDVIMLIDSVIKKEEYAAMMYRLKNENRLYQKLLTSKIYRFGNIILEIGYSFKTLKNFKRFFKILNGKVRWQYVKKRYPNFIENSNEIENIDIDKYFSDDNFVVYTCIFGNYDIPQEPVIKPNNCDFFLIGDVSVPKTSNWIKYDFKNTQDQLKGLTNSEKNRFCKMFPHILFPNYSKSVYIDGNIKVITDLTEFVNIKNRYGLLFHWHKARSCVYEEAKACKILKKASKKSINDYITVLKKEKFPRNYGMVECNVIIRDHTNTIMKNIMENWWEQYRKYVKRDQLSLPYVLWKYKIPIEDVALLGKDVSQNWAIRIMPHMINDEGEQFK